MRVLVTGASGFVGRWAVSSLVDRGAQVYATSRTPHPWPKTVVPCPGDLLNEHFVHQLLLETRPEIILHLAWNVTHGKFWTSLDNFNWISATLNLARLASSLGVGRFIGAGTCYEYDLPETSNCVENKTPLSPQTLYAVSKDATRRVLEEANLFSFAWARLFHLYGPFEHEQRLVASLARALVHSQPALLSQGLSIRDFLDARDAGAALAALALSTLEGPINIASGDGLRISEIAERLGQISGKPHLIQVGALPGRPNEPPRIVADIQRLHHELNFEPTRTLEQGLTDAYLWWRSQ